MDLYRQQINNIKRETRNDMIVDDVISTGLEATPGKTESVYNRTDFLRGEERGEVKFSTDGKTYTND